MGLESTFWAAFHEGVKSIEDLDIQRFETRMRKGVPDVEGCWGGFCFWVELKACIRPSRLTTFLEFKISKEQIIWLRNRWRCGGICFVLIRVGMRHEARVYMIKGKDALELRRCTEPDLEKLTVIPVKSNAKMILESIVVKGELNFYDS